MELKLYSEEEIQVTRELLLLPSEVNLGRLLHFLGSLAMQRRRVEKLIFQTHVYVT